MHLKKKGGGREGCWMLLSEKFQLGSSQTSREWFPFLVYHFAKRMRGTYGWKASHSSSLELKWLERGTPNVFFFFFSRSPVIFMSICRCMFVLEQREKVPSTGSASSGSGCIFLLESSWEVGRSNNQIRPASDSHSVCYVRTGHTIVVAMDTTCLPQLHRENSILCISNIYSESFSNPIRTWTEFQNICPNPIWPIR